MKTTGATTLTKNPLLPAGERTVYHVMQPVYRDGRDKPYWQRLGTAFANPGKNGALGSISVKLDALPLQGELVLFAEAEPAGASVDA